MLISPLAQATDTSPRIVSSAYWEDDTRQASLSQAQTQNYTPYQGIFNLGYSDATHWLRLTLAASEQPTSLRLTPPWIDEVTLYDPASLGHIFKAGDRHPEGINTQPSLGYTFTLPAAAKDRTLWVKLRSTSAHRLSIHAMPQDELPAANTQAVVWVSLYAAILLLMLLALLSIWWVQHERVLGMYLLRHSVYMVYGLGYLGLPALLLPNTVSNEFLGLLFSLAVTATLPTGLWFDLTLLSSYRPQRHLLGLLKLMTLASLVLPILALTGQTRIALQTTVSGLMLGAILVFVTALSCRPDPSVERLMSKKAMLGYYTLIFGSLLIGLSDIQGWTRAQGWSQYLLILHGLVSGLVMTVLLFVRGQRQHHLHEQMRWQLQKAEQDMASEQRQRREQTQFLHMLMHELKTPLSIVSLALGNRNNREENLAHAGRAVQDMKAIIERCVQADQMGELTLQHHHNAVDLPALITAITDQVPQLGPRLQLHTPDALPTVHTDLQLLQMVLTNLLSNAGRYSDPLTPVEVDMQVALKNERPGVQVRVRNTPGLAGWPDEAQLFSKYYRASGAQRESGSGLGLFLSRQLAQNLGGALDYAPNEQQVEFVLWIPLNPV